MGTGRPGCKIGKRKGGMMHTERNLESAIRTAYDKYTALLSKIDRIADDLMEAINLANISRVRKLLDTRQKALAELGPTTSDLIKSVEECDDILATSELTDHHDLRAIRSQFDALLTRYEAVLARQAACERLVKGRLDGCKSKLLAIRRNMDMRNAYTMRQPNRIPMYLDSRL
jgi:hypothetical protein